MRGCKARDGQSEVGRTVNQRLYQASPGVTWAIIEPGQMGDHRGEEVSQQAVAKGRRQMPVAKGQVSHRRGPIANMTNSEYITLSHV